MLHWWACLCLAAAVLPSLHFWWPFAFLESFESILHSFDVPRSWLLCPLTAACFMVCTSQCSTCLLALFVSFCIALCLMCYFFLSLLSFLPSCMPCGCKTRRTFGWCSVLSRTPLCRTTLKNTTLPDAFILSPAFFWVACHALGLDGFVWLATFLLVYPCWKVLPVPLVRFESHSAFLQDIGSSHVHPSQSTVFRKIKVGGTLLFWIMGVLSEH